MFMSVVSGKFGPVDDAIIAAHWGRAVDHGFEAALGVSTLGQSGGEVAFLVTPKALSGEGVLGCKAVALPRDGWALRVDEVAFPVGAIAHRHTHTGSGWRHLVSGALRIEAVHDTAVIDPGASWFEPAHSPVRAVALHGAGFTRFVRCMVIPLADVGRSTFQLCSAKDADLPRLQLTHRHFDHVVQDDSG